jgi:hypothetical protein
MRNNRWYFLIGLVAILGIIGIVYWLYKSDSRLTKFFSARQPATTDEL